MENVLVKLVVTLTPDKGFSVNEFRFDCIIRLKTIQLENDSPTRFVKLSSIGIPSPSISNNLKRTSYYVWCWPNEVSKNTDLLKSIIKDKVNQYEVSLIAILNHLSNL
jgi:hypothetical protein